MYTRITQFYLERWLFKKVILIIYGARQVGKTTLARHITEQFPQNDVKWIDCDLISNVMALQERNTEASLKQFIGNYRLVVIDEAQRVKNIGLTLKILHTYYPDMQIIVTGSSSFDLANDVKEPLTGRALEFKLFPLSFEELLGKYDQFALEQRIERILCFGLYPTVFDQDDEIARERLNMIVSNYLYHDILAFDRLKNADIIFKLLQLLALQIGSEISYSEIGQKLGMDRRTVEKYIDLLEQCFVIFRLRSFKRNLREEIAKRFKVYFWDLGVRNTLINNFNRLDMRNDVGALWENFCISERLKLKNNYREFINYYFWRTVEQKEIDYIEEEGGLLKAFEFKWQAKKNVKIPRKFTEEYSNSQFEVIDRNNCLSFLTGNGLWQLHQWVAHLIQNGMQSKSRFEFKDISALYIPSVNLEIKQIDTNAIFKINYEQLMDSIGFTNFNGKILYDRDKYNQLFSEIAKVLAGTAN